MSDSMKVLLMMEVEYFLLCVKELRPAATSNFDDYILLRYHEVNLFLERDHNSIYCLL